MKVVLFCGGQGMRLRDYSDTVPKPMVRVGARPILWHIMKYYAHFGHTEFVLALGYRAEAIKRFFLEYEEAESNNFVLSEGGRSKKLLGSDIDKWTITFVDTGLHTEIGERLRRVRTYLGDDEIFLANYADGLTNLDLNAHIDRFRATDATGTFLAVRPPQSYHVATVADDDVVEDIGPMKQSDLWLNGGYFVFRKEIFDHLGKGEDLVTDAFRRLIERRALLAHRFTGWWSPMDTFKDQQDLERLFQADEAPWMLWENGKR
jgi:glucose-1-phosphate cytidylyltransferase